ncbi:dTMP kinase [Candidatus Gottesmanbacteria bacterium]|nr:dTMP kinase [Candidatus Gottesmanbacteria bacterium]
MKGKLIIFEGISGTGKETQAKLLKDSLAKKGITAHVVYHPTPEVKLLLSEWRRERSIDHITEVYLFLADRYDRVRQGIKPALERGEWVISLRNYVSALVYQGKTEKDREWIRQEFARFEPASDVLFYFHLSAEQAMARIAKRREVTGESLGTFETINALREKEKAYAEVLNDIPHTVVDASQSIEQIHVHLSTIISGGIRGEGTI